MAEEKIRFFVDYPDDPNGIYECDEDIFDAYNTDEQVCLIDYDDVDNEVPAEGTVVDICDDDWTNVIVGATSLATIRVVGEPDKDKAQKLAMKVYLKLYEARLTTRIV